MENSKKVRSGLLAITLLLIPFLSVAWQTPPREQSASSEARRHFELAESFRTAGRLEQAQREYEEAIRLDPQMLAAYRYLGETLLRTGQSPRAVAVLEKAVAQENNNVDLLIPLGVAYGSEGRIEDSIRTLSRATEIDPGRPLIWLNLGASLDQSGDMTRAIEAFRSAVRLQPDFAYAHSRLGGALIRTGSLNEARSHLNKAIELQPNLTEAQYHLSDLLKIEGRGAEAGEVFRKASGLSLPKGPVPPERLEEGKRLSQKSCTTCHLMPSPASLPKDSWPFVMVWMATYLGFRNTAGLFTNLVSRDLIPDQPLVTGEELQKIFHYFVSTAPDRPAAQKGKPGLKEELSFFKVSSLSPEFKDSPLITLVRIDETNRRLFVGEGGRRELLIYTDQGRLQHRLPQVSQPISLTPDGKGFYLTLIGDFDINRQKGQVIHFKAEPDGSLTQTAVVRNFVRTADTRFHDLNGDDRKDVVISGFGDFNRGRFSWFENRDEGQYAEHLLIERSGALNAEVHDFTGDGRPDIMVLFAQGRNELFLFINQGAGRFEKRRIFEQPPGFGYNHFQLADFNHDGKMDIMTVNGNNMEMEDPPLRNYHGIRIYLNDGKLNFTEKFFYPMHGAIKAIAADFRRTGRLDIAAIAFYPDWLAKVPEGFVYLKNLRGLEFEALTIQDSYWGRWLTMDAGDLNGDGSLDLVLGGAFMLKGIPSEVRPKFQSEFFKTRPLLILQGVAQ
jgi:Flp pilus assembly protein TadD